jgi:PAS domain S-box-containing protein
MAEKVRAQVAAAVLGAGSDAIIAADRDETILFWNPGAERIFGFTAQEALGRSLHIIIPERLRARHSQGYAAMMRTGQSRYGGGDVLAVPGVRKDGSQVSLEFTLATLRDAQGEISGLVAVMRDVTVRFEEMKALRRRLREAAGQGAPAASASGNKA